MPRTHFIECDQHPSNDQHYGCTCGKISAELQEHADELAFESMRDEA